MKRQIPAGTRAERKAFMRGWIRERRADEPGVRLSRGQRRLIVVALYLLLLATVSALAGGPEGMGKWPSVLGAGPVSYLIWLFTAQVTCFLLLTYSVRGLLLGNAYIDERERELRDRATAVAYRILTGALGFISLYVIVAWLFKLGLPLPATAMQLLLALIPLGWIATSLPQSVLAWTLPDPELLAEQPAS
jgi:cytochrome bd-type quinol oxidase subunit 1